MKPVLIARAQRFLIGTALLNVLLAAFAYRTSSQHVESVAQTLSTASFVEKLDDLFSTVQDAETGQRGFLLTDRPDYVAPFLTAKAELPLRLGEIDSIARANGVSGSKIEQLHTLVAAKMRELEKTILLEQQGRHDAAIAEVGTDRGRILMTYIRSEIEQIKKDQQRVFQSRLDTQRRKQQLLNTVLVCAIAIALLFLLFAYHLSSRFAKERASVEHEIRALNADLENRVRVRTSELEESTTELKSRSKELERSNADLTQFAYVASHDLQEPLRMVASYMGLLEKRYREELDERARAYIQFATEGAARMQTLISDLLQYSRAGTQQVHKQSVPSEELVKTALKNLEIAIRDSQAQVHWSELPIVEADPTKITQVFQNLIGNAIKFRKEGYRPEIEIRSDFKADEWTFSVTDNGIGFDCAYQNRIYEIFQRLHGSGQYAGNGIGLSICKRIVEQHGGRLWADSKVDEGSTFYFTLPARQAAARKAS